LPAVLGDKTNDMCFASAVIDGHDHSRIQQVRHHVGSREVHEGQNDRFFIGFWYKKVTAADILNCIAL
jgi:hypothetical protein